MGGLEIAERVDEHPQHSVRIAQRAWPEFKGNGGHGLSHLKQRLQLDFRHHDAQEDARAAALTARGYTLTPAERPWGNMQIVVWNRSTGAVEAASDPRWKTVGGGESRDREAIYR